MKKIITTIIGVLLVIGIIFGIFWFFFNVGTRSDVEVEVKETKKEEVKQIETQVEIQKQEDDNVIIVDKKELQKKKIIKENIARVFEVICSKGKKGDWDDIKISDNIRNKYSEEKGILEDIDFDTVYLASEEDDNKIKVILHKKTNKGLKEYKTIIEYKLNSNFDVDEIISVKTEETNGEYNITDASTDESLSDMYIMDEGYSKTVIIAVATPQNEKFISMYGKQYWEYLHLTDNFKKNYDIKKGILKIDNVDEIDNVIYKDQDYNNNTVTITVQFNDRTTADYKVKWKANDKLELDEIISITNETENKLKNTKTARQGQKIGANEKMPVFETVAIEKIESNEEVEKSAE